MNHAAALEIAAIEPIAVIVKGDLSVDGEPDEWEAFESCYWAPFGDRLHVVRGNHDVYRHQAEYVGDQWIELPGVAVALLDTAIPGATTGTITTEQIDWLDDHCAGADRPVFVMGHHQQWIGDGPDAKRSDDYFGLHPDASDALDALTERRSNVVGYAAGHTHRHRVCSMARSGRPSIEIGCTKDFPGTWAEYRVHEDGIMRSFIACRPLMRSRGASRAEGCTPTSVSTTRPTPSAPSPIAVSPSRSADVSGW